MTSLFSELFDEIVLNTDLLDDAQVFLYPVIMLLLVNDELLDHFLCYIVVIKHRERLAHHRQSLGCVLVVIFEHFLDIGDDGILLDLNNRGNAQLYQAVVDLLCFVPFLLGFSHDLVSKLGETASLEKLCVDRVLLRVAEPALCE